MLRSKNILIVMITTIYLAFFVKYGTGFSMRWLINTNLETPKYSYWRLQCDEKLGEHTKNLQNHSFNYVSYLVSFGPNITKKNALDVECSGALLTMDYFITAAHCFFKPDGGKKNLHTLVATTGIKSMTRYNWWRQFRSISEAWIHDGYKPMTFINDIAIGTVSRSFTRGYGVDIIYAYVPYTYYEENLSDYWRMCTAVGFWKRSGIDEVDAECVRQIHPNSCNYTSGIRGAICVGAGHEPFKEQGSPLACYSKYYDYTVLTAIMLTSSFDYHYKKHWPALYLRFKSYWNSNLVRLKDAKE